MVQSILVEIGKGKHDISIDWIELANLDLPEATWQVAIGLAADEGDHEEQDNIP